jgi:hypothetical protein
MEFKVVDILVYPHKKGEPVTTPRNNLLAIPAGVLVTHGSQYWYSCIFYLVELVNIFVLLVTIISIPCFVKIYVGNSCFPHS